MTPAELMALARFGAACLITSREELCDLDAGWLQDVAEALGCLRFDFRVVDRRLQALKRAQQIEFVRTPPLGWQIRS